MDSRIQGHIDAILQGFEGEEDEKDVLRCLSDAARLRFCTADLLATVKRDVHELFEKNGVTGELVGAGLELCKRLNVVRMDEIRTVGGYTALDAVVEVAPPSKPKKLQRKKQQQADDPLVIHFTFRREPGNPSGDAEGKVGAKRRRESEGEGEDSSQEGSHEAEEDEGEEEEGDEDEDEGRVPRTIVTFTIATSRGHKRPEGVLEANILSLFDRPSPSGVLPVGVEQPDEEDDGVAPADRAMVGVDGEALEELAAWLAPDMSPTEALMFLLQCPYHEEEWDVIGVVMDIIMADDDDEGGCAEDGCGCHHDHHHHEEEEDEEKEEEEIKQKPAPPPASKSGKRRRKK